MEYAIVDPTGAEMTALKIVASIADAERTSPVLLRTNSLLAVAMAILRRPDRLELDTRVENLQSLNTIEHQCQEAHGHGGTTSGQDPTNLAE
jgi:hypothetical protein